MTFEPSDDGPHSVPPLSRDPQASLSAVVLVSWEGAVAGAVAAVWYCRAAGSQSPHPRRCQLCLLGLEEEVVGGEAATWSRGGSEGGGGGCGGGGDLASARMEGSGSRRRRRRMRKGVEVGEV